jgi:hypothetical protein
MLRNQAEAQFTDRAFHDVGRDFDCLGLMTCVHSPAEERCQKRFTTCFWFNSRTRRKQRHTTKQHITLKPIFGSAHIFSGVREVLEKPEKGHHVGDWGSSFTNQKLNEKKCARVRRSQHAVQQRAAATIKGPRIARVSAIVFRKPCCKDSVNGRK